MKKPKIRIQSLNSREEVVTERTIYDDNSSIFIGLPDEEAMEFCRRFFLESPVSGNSGTGFSD